MTLATINAIWIGPRMGPIHAACLKSFLRHGHRVHLHVYDCPEDVPDGVSICDANELISRDALFRHRKTGSLAPFVDLLRYEILRLGLGLYVDCDVFCLRPIEDADHIFGWQMSGSVNNAILKLPRHDPVVRDLAALKDASSFIPPWQPKRRQRKWRLRSLVGEVSFADLPYGTSGPDALTWYLQKHDRLGHAVPSDVFYPLAWVHASRLFDPDLRIEDLVTRRTVALHLFHEAFRQDSDETIPEGSPLHRMIASID